MLLLDWIQTSQKVLMADRLQDKKQRVCVTATWRAKMCDAKGLLFKRLKWSLSYKTHSVLQ